MTDAPDPLEAAMEAAPAPSDAPPAPAGADPMEAAMEGSAQAQADEDAPKPSPPAKRMDISKMGYAEKVAQAESHFNPTIKNPQSSATGLGQFLGSGPKGSPPLFVRLVRQYQPDAAKGLTDNQVLALRNDPTVSLQAINDYGSENGKWLGKQGVPVNDAAKYGAHWFGPAGFLKLYNADPDTPVAQVLPQQVVQANHLQGKTAQDVMDSISGKMGMENVPHQFDASPQSLWQLGKGVAQNTPRSGGKAISGLVDFLRYPGTDLDVMGQLGKGLTSLAAGYAGLHQDPVQKAKDEGLVRALGQEYADKYGSVEGFANALYNDPVGVLADVSTIASGGELAGAKSGSLLSKVGDLAEAARIPVAPEALRGAGRLASGTGKVAGSVAKMTNPLDLGGIMSGAVSKVAPAVAKVFSPAGKLEPEAAQALDTATKGAVSETDLSALDPAAKDAFARPVGEKGASPASAREGILKAVSPEMVAPYSTVSGIAPPDVPAVQRAVGEATARNNAVLAREASLLSGSKGPSPSDLAAAVEDAHVNSFNKAHGAYRALGAIPGSFGPAMDGAELETNIGHFLGQSGMPPSPQLLARSAEAYPQANKAIGLLNDALVNGNTRLGGEITTPELLELRRQLTGLRDAADGSDIKAVGSIIDGFNKTLEDAGARGEFTDPNGIPVHGIGDQIKQANQLYRDHFNTFENKVGPNATLARAVKVLKDGEDFDANGFRVPSGDTARHMSVQENLSRNLFNPHQGPITYQLLSDAVGGPGTSGADALDTLVRQTALANDGTMLTAPKDLGPLVSRPGSVVEKAFASDPQGLARARILHAASAINNARPLVRASTHPIASNLFGTWLPRLAAGLVGHDFMGTAGLIGGELAEAAREHIATTAKVSRALKGAPKTRSLRRPVGKLARALIHPKTLAASHLVQQGDALRSVPAYASGGKVGDEIEPLVQRLLKLADQAKRRSNQATKPLLDVPDSAVAKALGVAQQAL